MAPSTFWISMSPFLISWYLWALLFAVDALRQISVVLNNVNEILLMFHDIVLTYCSPFLMEISSSSRLEAFSPHTTSCCKHPGRRCSMFNVENSSWMSVQTFFPVLMPTIDLLRFEVLVRFGMWETDPDIKECLSLVLPESTCTDIQSHILCLY